MGTAIEVANLNKRYGNLLAVDSLSFEVNAGELFALLGANGAGKTTTVEILEGYRRADSGQARVFGLDPMIDRKRLAPRIGLMLQEGGLYPGIEVAAVVRLFASFYPHSLSIDDAMERAGIAQRAGQKVRRLSGGEKQRLSLALAIVGRPELLFLDEPTGALDPQARAGAWARLTALRDEGTTIMFTTHLLEEAERFADRVVIMHRGRCVASGPPAALTASPDSFEFTTSVPIDAVALARVLRIERVLVVGARSYAVPSRAEPELLAALSGWLSSQGTILTELSTQKGSLEALFLKLTTPEPTTSGDS